MLNQVSLWVDDRYPDWIRYGLEYQYDDLMAKLGKYKSGKSCLYIKRLSDVDEPTLRELIKQSAEHVAGIDWSKIH